MKGERDETSGLFPPIEPFRQGWLATDAPHRLYWEECGAPAGTPILFLHGGPGAGCAPVHRRFFDPRQWRVVLTDQRGAGRSTPNAAISGNTTADLIADIEALRGQLGIERWFLFGGSWGSTLALAYGEAHPERCLGFILRGIFLFRQSEVDWFLDGMGNFFPEAARSFRDFLPEAERADPLAAYHRRLTDRDPSIHLPAAQAWYAYEEACSRLVPEPVESRISMIALAMARIEAHYMVNKGFMDENALLSNIKRLHGLPAIVVQGRYDVVCPIRSAFDLVNAWPGSEFVVVPEAGHSALDGGIRNALVNATDRIRARAGLV